MKTKLLYFLPFLFLVTCKSNPRKTKAEKIDYLVLEAVSNKEFAGSILVADQGEVIYQKSVGKADHEKNLPNTDSTRFLIASVSKPVTAILILCLADNKILGLDDTLSKYFDIEDPKTGNITIHQLLTHTSGLPEIINKEKGINIGELIKRAVPEFEPGSDFKYSNSGYVILKEIAQVATEKKYSELLSTEIFDPAGMTSSGVAENSTLKELAHGYSDASQTIFASIDFPLENVDGAGTVYSTVADMYKLDRVLYSGDVLSKEMRGANVKTARYRKIQLWLVCPRKRRFMGCLLAFRQLARLY